MTRRALSLSNVLAAWAGRRLPLGALALVLLAGCAEVQIREDSQLALASGDYEHAIHALAEGVRRYPDNASLRAGLLQARAEASTHLIAAAAAQRSEGRFADAQHLLQRAKALDPKNSRIDALLTELDTEQRQRAAQTEAEQWLEKKRPDTALRVVEQALKDNSRHPGLLALQRRIELDQRQIRQRAAQMALAETRPITLDFRDANLRTVLDVVSRSSGINFILDRDIRPDARVTIFMRQARVEDALDLLIGTNQLAKKVIDPQTIVVYPNTPEKQREYQEQIVRVFYMASAEAKGAAAFLKSMLKLREPFVDERSNMVALRESEENIQLAERLLMLYDTSEPEVLMELEVVEISSSRLTELGVKFPNSISLTPLAPSGATGLTLSDLHNLNSDHIGVGIGGVTLNLRREVDDVTTLANPRIRARNKEKAKVLIGDKIPVITTTSGSTGFVSDSVNYLDVGLKLDVEPTIYADDEVAIKLGLEVSTLGTAVKTTSGTLAYQIGTRSASTVLRLRDGETQLLAGLISHDQRASSSRLPGVGDLPVLGRLFSSQLDEGKRTELVLAVTPRILRNIRHPDSNETELRVGTDALPQLKRLTVALPLAASGETSAAAPPSAPPVDMGSTEVPMAERPTGVTFKWTGPTEAKLGDIVALQMTMNSSVELRGQSLQIDFDQTRLQLVDAVEGEFFKQGGAATSFSRSGESSGQVNIGVLRNQATGASGDAPLLTLKFKTLAPGAASVRLQSAQSIGLSMAPANAKLLPAWTVQVQ